MATKKPEAAETSTSTAVAEVKTGALAVAPDFLDAGDFGGAGFEGADADSFAIPFLQILQKMSPIVDEDDDRHVKGAKAGMLYNTVTQRLYEAKENGFHIVPCSYKHSYIQWGARDSGGGFKGEFTPEEMKGLIESGKAVAIEGNYYAANADGSPVDVKKADYYADTRSHFVIVVDPETAETGPAILSLSGTQIKSSRMLMTAMQQRKVDAGGGVKKTPPMFLNMVKVTTQTLSNDKGNWAGIVLTLDGNVKSKELFEEARAFYKQVTSGDAKADYSKAPAADQAAPSDKPQEAEGF